MPSTVPNIQELPNELLQQILAYAVYFDYLQQKRDLGIPDHHTFYALALFCFNQMKQVSKRFNKQLEEIKSFALRDSETYFSTLDIPPQDQNVFLNVFISKKSQLRSFLQTQFQHSPPLLSFFQKKEPEKIYDWLVTQSTSWNEILLLFLLFLFPAIHFFIFYLAPPA